MEDEDKIRVYFAGPLFTAGEKYINARVASHLRSRGYDVYLPQEHDARDKQTIFDNNVVHLLRSDVVVANMDGADPDSGTAWECGFAYGSDVPVILWRTDGRREMPPLGPFNLMLHVPADVSEDFENYTVERVAAELDDCIRSLGVQAGDARARLGTDDEEADAEADEELSDDELAEIAEHLSEIEAELKFIHERLGIEEPKGPYRGSEHATPEDLQL